MLFLVNMNEFHVSFPLQLELLKQLSDILKHGGNSQVARMQAGIQLKNALYSKDPNLRFQYIQRWLAFPEDVRLYVKKNVSEQLTTSGLKRTEFGEYYNWLVTSLMFWRHPKRCQLLRCSKKLALKLAKCSLVYDTSIQYQNRLNHFFN